MKKSFVLVIAFVFQLGLAGFCWAAPAPPVMTHATNGLNVTVNWSQVADATGYTLYYAPYPFAGAATIGSLDVGTDTSFSIDLWEGAAYYIAVKAYNDQESSAYSNIGILTIPYTTAPESPQLSASLEGTTLSATWGSVPGATGYKLYYTLSAYTGQEAFLPLDVGNQTSFSYTGLSEGHTYSIAVVAYNAFGESNFSNVAQLTLPEEDIGDEPLVFFRETLSFGTYQSQVEGDLHPTIFVFNGDGTGSWSYPRGEGGAITWDVINNVLIITFGTDGFEEYTLVSGSSLSGIVSIYFSDEIEKNASWSKID